MDRVLWLIAHRLALGLVILVIISIIVFLAVELLPGDVTQAILGQSATPETVAAFRHQLGLDRPPVERYFAWLAGFLTGDLGQSLANQRPIAELVPGRLANTLFLAAYAATIAVPLSLALGILTALHRNSWFDRAVNVAALTAISFPEFFVAYILIFLVAQSGFFPSIADVEPGIAFTDRLYRAFLPALTLTLVVTAHMMRMTRASLINLLASPYIEMAQLKGLSQIRVITHHALPNALAPIINVVALNLAYLIVGVVIVEVVFVYPGLGQLLVDSVAKRDVPVVQAASLIFAATYILLNLVADVLSTLSNPRIIHPK